MIIRMMSQNIMLRMPAVNALIKGETVKMTKTVAIGCTIKVKK